MNFRQPIEYLRATPFCYLQQIQKETALGMQTLRSIKYGTTADPRLSTLEALGAWFAAHPNTPRVYIMEKSGPGKQARAIPYSDYKLKGMPIPDSARKAYRKARA